MKKILILILVSLCLFSCETSYISDGTAKSNELTFTVMRVGKCQYLYRVMGVNEGFLFTHSGECDNPIHSLNTSESNQSNDTTYSLKTYSALTIPTN